MKVVKVFNNNVVATLTKEGKEAIVTGPGVGFRKLPGDEVDYKKIQKKFVVDEKRKRKIYQLLEETSYEVIDLAENILDEVRKRLYENVQESALIGLIDHISYAIEREKSEIELPNLVLHETKWIYPKEYEIALWALHHIHNRTGIQLPEDEAGYITLHIINATSEKTSEDALEIVNFTKHVIKILEKEMHFSLDMTDMNYSRLLTHIKFLARRIITDDHTDLVMDELFYHQLVKDRDDIKRSIDRVNNYLKAEYKTTMSKDEMVYLSIHILRVSQKIE